MDNFFIEPFYSEAYCGGSDVISIPINLDYYRTDNDNIYVFHWTFDPRFILPALATLDFELQLDTVPTFDSPDLKSFIKTTALLYQNGNVVKGYTVPVYTRAEDNVIQFYVRVRVKDGPEYGDFSGTLIAETIQNVVRSVSDRLLLALPDNHVYPRDESVLSLEDRTSNISKVFQEYATEFDREYLEKENTLWDGSLRFVRDERIYYNFGFRYSFQKPFAMQYVDYRYLLRNIQLAVFLGSTYEAIKLIGKGLTGVNPLIVPFSDLISFITAKQTILNKIIPGSPYQITLPLSPRSVPIIPGFNYKGDPNDTPTPGVPALGEFTFNHLTKILTFNAANAGNNISITYSTLNDIYTHLDPLDPPVVYSRQESGFAIKVVLQNPGGFSIDLSSAYFLLSQIIPAHVRFVVTVT